MTKRVSDKLSSVGSSALEASSHVSIEASTGSYSPNTGLAPSPLDEYIAIAKHIIQESVHLSMAVTEMPESLSKLFNSDMAKNALDEAMSGMVYGLAANAYMYDNVTRYQGLVEGDKLPDSFVDKWN